MRVQPAVIPSQRLSLGALVDESDFLVDMAGARVRPVSMLGTGAVPAFQLRKSVRLVGAGEPQRLGVDPGSRLRVGSAEGARRDQRAGQDGFSAKAISAGTMTMMPAFSRVPSTPYPGGLALRGRVIGQNF